MSLNTNRYNWGEQLKSSITEAAASPKNFGGGARKTGGSPPLGRHEGFLQAVKPEVYGTGSYGVTFTFVFENDEAKGTTIRDRIILQKKDGSNVNYANVRLFRRLRELGMAEEKIAAFVGPRGEHDIGDLRLVIGAPVSVIVAEDKNKDGSLRKNTETGNVYKVVKAVYAREVLEK